ncbi:hypothetical protein HOY80DRAFT_1001257 [Tuber brumale]|nr:hypothetical protein HOY80DRAFT_1001257 [Tuber brumale]
MCDNTTPKKRKLKWNTSYSNMTIGDAEIKLGFRMITLESGAVPVEEMLKGNAYLKEAEECLMKTRERVYDRIRDHLTAEGYPSEADPYFKEANASDLVYATIVPIIVNVSDRTRSTLLLHREREVVATDSSTRGYEEFVVIDRISLREERFVFVIEAKRSSLAQALKQCLLAVKDMGDNNGGGVVYGFITTGSVWQMMTYDGKSWRLTEQFLSLFPRMGTDKERWIRDYSVLVDCMYAALTSGGRVVGS